MAAQLQCALYNCECTRIKPGDGGARLAPLFCFAVLTLVEELDDEAGAASAVARGTIDI